MGTERRSGSLTRPGSPGPGAYNLSTSMGKGPKYTMSSKNTAFADPLKYVVSPGPGMYTPKSTFKNVSYTYF